MKLFPLYRAFPFSFLLLVLCFPQNSLAGKIEDDHAALFFELEKGDTVLVISTAGHEELSRPNPILQMFKAKQKKNKKITAALLAFPFPFGIAGLHRIYLGTAPYVPVVYIGTLGGVLGILPFIDFCVIVLDKDIDRYIENKSVLMWVQENAKPAK